MVVSFSSPSPSLIALAYVGEALEEAVVDRLLHVEARRRDADLAGVAVLERRDGVGGLLRIGVAEHDDRRMPAELHGGALHALGGELGEMLADRHRAGERDLAHDRSTRSGARRSVAGTPNTRLSTPGGTPASSKHFTSSTQAPGVSSDALRMIEQPAASAAADLARRRERREIPRRERRDDADRLGHDHLAHASGCGSG